MKIHLLSEEMINQIAAGEVIESADSVVKELMENAIDADASKIEVLSEEGGLKSIIISDNGTGISKEDLDLVATKHATSKLHSIADLETILTYGFRGEAVSSISSISKIRIETGVENEKLAWMLKAKAGRIESKEPITHFKGTRFIIEDLFFKTPVRKKFIRSLKSEDSKIRKKFVHFALAHEKIKFTLIQNGREIYNLSFQTKKERIISLFGKNFKDSLIEVNFQKYGLSVTGFISNSSLYKSDRKGQFMFVNNRAIEWKNFSFILKKCYGELLPTKSYPFAFLFFTLPTEFIDVNVHPTKKEIRFLNENHLISFFIQSLEKSLNTNIPVSILELNSFKNEKTQNSKALPTQIVLNSHPNSQKIAAYDIKKATAGIKLESLGEDLVQNDLFIPKKHFGLLFETFILAEAEDGLYIIDQHTAHERIRYEEVLNEMEKKELKIQPLLTPIRIDFSLEDTEEILSMLKDYEEVGICLEFMDGSFILRAIPSYLEIKHAKEIVIDFLNKVRNDNKEKLYDEMAKCISCRTAIKKGDHISDHLIAELLNRLSFCKNPSRCPHGRPTLIKLDMNDLEKLFKRK